MTSDFGGEYPLHIKSRAGHTYVELTPHPVWIAYHEKGTPVTFPE